MTAIPQCPAHLGIPMKPLPPEPIRTFKFSHRARLLLKMIHELRAVPRFRCTVNGCVYVAAIADKGGKL